MKLETELMAWAYFTSIATVVALYFISTANLIGLLVTLILYITVLVLAL